MFSAVRHHVGGLLVPAATRAMHTIATSSARRCVSEAPKALISTTATVMHERASAGLGYLIDSGKARIIPSCPVPGLLRHSIFPSISELLQAKLVPLEQQKDSDEAPSSQLTFDIVNESDSSKLSGNEKFGYHNPDIYVAKVGSRYLFIKGYDRIERAKLDRELAAYPMAVLGGIGNHVLPSMGFEMSKKIFLVTPFVNSMIDGVDIGPEIFKEFSTNLLVSLFLYDVNNQNTDRDNPHNTFLSSDNRLILHDHEFTHGLRGNRGPANYKYHVILSWLYDKLGGKVPEYSYDDLLGVVGHIRLHDIETIYRAKATLDYAKVVLKSYGLNPDLYEKIVSTTLDIAIQDKTLGDLLIRVLPKA